MYIKQIIIQGFKSYKDQTVIEPFSPRHNVIVGRNGTGKSNFFAAIRFVLSDAYTQMGREERQALLHEGSGAAVMSAYVEVIFDNGDERFPGHKGDVILRRTIGLKKDEYSVNRKAVTKSEVMSLLESAGFSRSNPYYIVPQGRVTALTNMKDTERLMLLKEVAGTQVYESRRIESLKIMGDTEAKRSKIDESLGYIVERLDELEEEKEELRQYQEVDRERRCLEYAIFHREQEHWNQQLEQYEESRLNGADEADALRDQFVEGEGRLSKIDSEIKNLRQQMELLTVDKRQFEDERRDCTRQRAKVELDVRDISNGQAAAQSANRQREKGLQEVQTEMIKRQNELAEILPQYNEAKEQEQAIRSRLVEAESTRQRLYGKQGRSANFKSKGERDSWLRREVEEVNVALSTRKAVIMQSDEEVVQLEKDIQQREVEIAQIRKTFEDRDSKMQAISSEVAKAKEVRDKLSDQRKERWREEARLDSVMRNTQQELDRAERVLSHMMDQNTSRGTAAVRRIKRQHNLQGVYGTLAELFTVPERYKTATEVTAGNSLFHYVVDTDETATKVLEVLQREKSGRVTFMPLNRLRPRGIEFPKANDAIPLISKLQFDEKFRPAFEQVFGKTIVCPNLQVAANYARSHGVGAITPEGDRSDKKGALTGGYHDPRNSRLDAVHALTKLRDEAESHRTRADEIRKELEQMDQEVTKAHSELQKAEHRRLQADNSWGPLQQELRSKSLDVQAKRDDLESRKKSKENIETAINELGQQLNSFEIELASDFKKALSTAEEQQLEHLTSSIPELRKQNLDLSKARAGLEAEKTNIEVELQENLRPRLDQLQSQDLDLGSAHNDSRLRERLKELKQINKKFETLQKSLQDAETSIENLNTQLGELDRQRGDKQQEQEQIAQAIERLQLKSQHRISKKAMAAEKMADATKSIRDLGVLPEQAFSTKYSNMNSDEALKRLNKVRESLKKYSHVNKKAFEQYSNFTNQRETLTQRRAELDSSQAAIQELIEVLDQRKDEAIERTFKQVSKEFASVFEKLVPAGRGRLVIQRKSDRQQQRELDEEEDDSDEGGGGAAGAGAGGRGGGSSSSRRSVENYIGVGISVSFNSKHDEQQRIQQLSGGQKSLCALGLVFAIQQCDPAPFYLFDEIDANLDAQYRTAVASLLQEISASGQFICTTFRPEMVYVAEKCYGVAYSNKTSSIDVVSREQALEFVEGQISGA